MSSFQPNRVLRKNSEYARELDDQVTLLRNAAKRYDEGCEPEAKNLALRIRVLVHDGRTAGSSLLAQLGVRDRLPYRDTGMASCPSELVMHGGLCIISAVLGPGGSSSYRPPLDNLSPDRIHPPAAFIDWWNDSLVESEGKALTRWDFIRWVANQDGGAHVDARVDVDYARLAEDGLAAFQPMGGLVNLALPSVRQIAHELLTTIERQLVEDVNAPRGVAVRDPICPLSIHVPPDTGRNDLCPCGSGLKSKRCFGLRAPRRRLSLDELQAGAA